MDKQLLRDYRERYRVVAEREQQEQMTATITERWQQLNALWSLAVGLGLTPSSEDVDLVRQRWVKLKERYERA